MNLASYPGCVGEEKRSLLPRGLGRTYFVNQTIKFSEKHGEGMLRGLMLKILSNHI